MKEKKNPPFKRIILLVAVTAFVIYFLLMFFPLGKFSRVGLQPGILITFIQDTDQKLNLIIESDVIVSCISNYRLRVTYEDTTEEMKWIKVDGLYEYKNLLIKGCRRQRRRPTAVIDIGKIRDNSRIETIFELDNRVNRYLLVMENGKLNITPHDGGFTTIIAYKRFDGLLEKYSEKYGRNYYGDERINGKSYLNY